MAFGGWVCAERGLSVLRLMGCVDFPTLNGVSSPRWCGLGCRSCGDSPHKFLSDTEPTLAVPQALLRVTGKCGPSLG
jgi:hypothetical protein